MQRGLTVIGASPDTVEAQAAFKAKNSLPFTLLADADHAVGEAYGAWGERERDGRTFMGMNRHTYVIGPDGTIERVYRTVTPATHAKELLEDLG